MLVFARALCLGLALLASVGIGGTAAVLHAAHVAVASEGNSTCRNPQAGPERLQVAELQAHVTQLEQLLRERLATVPQSARQLADSTSTRSLQAATPLYLSIMLPFSGGWPGGLAMLPVMNMMVEGINRNPAMLPGYELIPIYQDDECDRSPGLRLFMKNMFDNVFEGLSVAADKTITKADVSHDIVGMIGPGCSGPAQEICAFNGAARMPLISPSATSPVLLDRTRFPFFWRTMAGDSVLIVCYCYIALALGHARVGSVTGNLRLFAQWNSHLANMIAETGLDATAMPEAELEGHTGAQAYVYTAH